MKNKSLGKELEIRTKSFAIDVIKLSSLLSNTIELRVIRNQLVKSGTSIGANYREANKSRELLALFTAIVNKLKSQNKNHF